MTSELIEFRHKEIFVQKNTPIKINMVLKVTQR
jgi:hypothetical protein